MSQFKRGWNGKGYDADNNSQKIGNIPGHNCRLTTWRVKVDGKQHYEVRKGNDVVGKAFALKDAVDKARQAGFAK